MTLPNYGLPEPQELVGAVRQQAQANHDALTSLYQAAGQPIVSTIHNNDTALSVIGKTLRTAVNRTIGVQNRRLNGLPVAAPETGYGVDQATGSASVPFTMPPAEGTRQAANINTVPGVVMWYVYQLPGGGCAAIETADPSTAPGTIIGGPFSAYADAIVWLTNNCQQSQTPVPTPVPAPVPVMPGPTMPAGSMGPAPTPSAPCGLTASTFCAAVVCHGGGATGRPVVIYPFVPSAPRPVDEVVLGTFPDMAQAQAWINAHPEVTCGPIGTPPPPTSPGVWIVTCPPGGSAIAMLASDYDSQHLNWTVLQYGLASQAAAQEWIGAHPEACGGGPIGTPPIPIPTPPPIGPEPSPIPPIGPVPQPLTSCDFGSPLTIALPGTPEFCAALPQIQDSLVALGNALIGAALNAAGGVGQAFTGLSIPGIGGTILSLLQDYLPAQQSQLVSIVRCWRDAIRTIPVCPPDALLAVGVVSATVRLLEHFRFGTDAGLWATVDVGVDLPGIRQTVDYVLNYLCPAEVPAIGDIIEAYLRDTITQDMATCLLRMRGADWGAWRPVIGARREQLTAQEYIQWARRHGLPPETQQALVRRLGFINADEAKARVELYDELPTVADIIHFLTRNIYNTGYVADYGLMEGFEERFWVNYGPACEAIGLSKYWAAQHYAAHWVTAAPGQLATFVHRLRPGAPGVTHPFTVQDYERLLAEQDVAPYIRQRFVDTVYHVPALSYVREMYRNYTVSDDELRSIHLDLGFSPTDAERFVAVDRLARSRMRASEAHGWTPAALAHGYLSGRLTPADVTGRMATMGYTADEASQLMARAQADLDYSTFMRARSRTVFAALTQVKQALTVGVIDQTAAVQQLQGMGWSANFAQSWVQITGIQGRVAVVKQGVSTIRGAYYRGEVNQQQAAQLLQQLGIVPDAVDQYVSLWAVRLGRKRKQLSKAEIIKELCEGAISTGDAVARLANLGYEAPDIELYVADAGRCIASRRSKAEAAAARQAAAESKTLLKLQQEAARQAKQLLREAEKAEPVSKLQKWAKLGIIQPSYFARRMRRYGYSDSEITEYWQEAAAAKGSVADATAIGPALQGPGNREPGSFAGSAAP